MEFEPRTTIASIPQGYVDCPPARGRTDLYLVGMQGCGKSSLLAGLLKYMFEADLLRYVPQADQEHDWCCKTYYQGLLDGISENKLPPLTKIDTYIPMQFDIGPKQKRPLTVIEHSGKALKALSEAFMTGAETWDQLAVGRCLKNDNPKTLLFLFDYGMLTGRSQRFSAIEQEQMLNNALDVFSYDGDGRYRDKNCTMSKVKTVSVVFTKSDLMDADEGRSLTYEERGDIALQSLIDRCTGFMNNLSEICGKYEINAHDKEHPFEVLVSTFSIGRFDEDCLLKADFSDSKRLSEFIVSTTPPKRGLFGWLK